MPSVYVKKTTPNRSVKEYRLHDGTIKCAYVYPNGKYTLVKCTNQEIIDKYSKIYQILDDIKVHLIDSSDEEISELIEDFEELIL